MFEDRIDAGRELARHLLSLRGHDVVVVGLPRGGVPVAAQVAEALDAPLDVILVRKLGLPFQSELAMGAIGEDGVRVLNEDIINEARVTESELAEVERSERRELDRRASCYRAGRERVSLAGRVVVVVDDGIATGSTAKAACQVVRSQQAQRIILAVPVAPPEWEQGMADVADELISLSTPHSFAGVGQFYRDFSATSDDEVVAALDQAWVRSTTAPIQTAATPSAPTQTAPTQTVSRPPHNGDVEIVTEQVRLGGHLTIPKDALGIVIFVHGSGSSRHSPRNRHVASVFNDAGLATLLFDLLTADEERDRTNVFDIELLAKRLVSVTNAVADDDRLHGLPIGYFGASTGAAAALRAAAEPDSAVRAVVSRGGRPDLAGDSLALVAVPTLLIVGGDDRIVLDVNAQAQAQLRCENELHVVPGATHLFEEPGTLQVAAGMASNWFTTHLASQQSCSSVDPGRATC